MGILYARAQQLVMCKPGGAGDRFGDWLFMDSTNLPSKCMHTIYEYLRTQVTWPNTQKFEVYSFIWVSEEYQLMAKGAAFRGGTAIDVLTFVSGNKRDHYAKRKSVVTGLQRVFWNWKKVWKRERGKFFSTKAQQYKTTCLLRWLHNRQVNIREREWGCKGSNSMKERLYSGRTQDVALEMQRN